MLPLTLIFILLLRKLQSLLRIFKLSKMEVGGLWKMETESLLSTIFYLFFFFFFTLHSINVCSRTPGLTKYKNEETQGQQPRWMFTHTFQTSLLFLNSLLQQAIHFAKKNGVSGKPNRKEPCPWSTLKILSTQNSFTQNYFYFRRTQKKSQINISEHGALWTKMPQQLSLKVLDLCI